MNWKVHPNRMGGSICTCMVYRDTSLGYTDFMVVMAAGQ